jgi:hypothetical protein
MIVARRDRVHMHDCDKVQLTLHSAHELQARFERSLSSVHGFRTDPCVHECVEKAF